MIGGNMTNNKLIWLMPLYGTDEEIFNMTKEEAMILSGLTKEDLRLSKQKLILSLSTLKHSKLK
jgi:hypothetical protein